MRLLKDSFKLFIIFFTKRFYTHQKAPKSTKKHKKHKNVTKQKHKYANKWTKIKNTLKKHLRGEKLTYLHICACEEKK